MKQFAFLIGALLLLASAARADNYPSRPITLVVPYAAGGGNDVMARIVADKMGTALGQPIVVENRGGAGGSIATRAVAHAQEVPGVEERIADGAVGPRIHLALQHVQVGRRIAGLGVRFRIAAHRHLEGRATLDAGHQFGAAGIALRMGRERRPQPARRIAAQRHDMAHAGIPVVADHGVDFLAAGAHAGQLAFENSPLRFGGRVGAPRAWAPPWIPMSADILIGLAREAVLIMIFASLPALGASVIAGAVVFLAMAGIMAAYFPARRATRVDPTTALRHE